MQCGAQPEDVVLAMLTGVLDRRKSERLAIKAAVEILIPQFAPLGCIATNVSDGGAKIQVRGADVPDVFVLHFTETGRKRHCRVVWRQGAEVGVAFTDKAQVNFGRRIASP
jgi:PilZ domain